MKQTKQQGFSLIELLIAITVFSIVMLALSGLIVNGMKVRRGNETESQALAYANAVLERYKSFWISAQTYNSGIVLSDQQLPEKPQGFSVVTAFHCIDLQGVIISPAACSTMIPPLRRVEIEVQNSEAKTVAQLSTEIGNPAP